MNYTSLLTSSPFGLALLITVLSYPFTFLMKLMGFDQAGFGLVFAGHTAAYLFTYYWYKARMSVSFKLKAMLWSVLFGLVWFAAILVLFPDVTKLLLMLLEIRLSDITDVKTALITASALILQLAIPAVAWYAFITMGDKQALAPATPKK